MKPYILNYSESVAILPAYINGINHSTLMTNTIESSDPDEIHADSTLITRTLESDDSDEVLFGSTIITKTLESSDDDELVANFNYFESKDMATMITETIEPADPDEMSF